MQNIRSPYTAKQKRIRLCRSTACEEKNEEKYFLESMCHTAPILNIVMSTERIYAKVRKEINRTKWGRHFLKSLVFIAFASMNG